jgi:PAS domain-containing protein
VSLDPLELRLTAALQRFNTLQRRAETGRDAGSLLTRTLEELSTALEEVRVAREQLVESRLRTEELQEQLRQQAAKYWRLFDEMHDAYVVTRPDSAVVEVNKAAAGLLNVSQRFLTGKALSVFVCENRGPFLQTCARLAEEGGHADLALRVRPRERAPLSIAAHVAGSDGELRWLLRPASDH